MAEGGNNKIINLVPESPPKNLSLDEIVMIQNQLKDFAMFHTIALSDSFEMKIGNHNDKTIECRVRATMEKAFWNVLQENLEKDPPDYEHALILLQEIKEKLISLLLNGSRSQQMKLRIDEILDVQLIRQQISNNVFNFGPYSIFIIDTMATLCAPERDDLIASLRDIKEITPLYKKFFEILDIMQVDFSNFGIKAMQPIIKSHSIEAEKIFFVKILNFQREKGIDGLLITKEWLKMNISTLNEKRVSLNNEKSALKITDVLNAAYVDLLQREYYPLPETVAFDKTFIDNIRAKISKVSFMSTVIALIQSIFSEHLINEALRKQLKDNLTILCEDFDPLDREAWARGIAEHVLNKIKTDWTSSNASQPTSMLFFDENKQQDFISQIVASVNTEKQHPVLALLINRLMSFLHDVIDKNAADQLPTPIGFNLFSTELLNITAEFRHIFGYNRKVFGPIYDNLITHLINNPAG